MKKTLFLLCAACIAVGMQAQTYMVNDFESGLNGANAAWGGTAELIDNPCSSSDNSSTKVLKVVSTEFANVAIPLNLPEGKTLAIIQVFVYNLLCWKGRKISHGLVMN